MSMQSHKMRILNTNSFNEGRTLKAIIYFIPTNWVFLFAVLASCAVSKPSFTPFALHDTQFTLYTRFNAVLALNSNIRVHHKCLYMCSMD